MVQPNLNTAIQMKPYSIVVKIYEYVPTSWCIFIYFLLQYYNASVYERCGMRKLGSGVEWGVVEWVKRSTLRWFGHIERKGNEEFVKKAYLSSAEGMNRRGRPF